MTLRANYKADSPLTISASIFFNSSGVGSGFALPQPRKWQNATANNNDEDQFHFFITDLHSRLHHHRSHTEVAKR